MPLFITLLFGLITTGMVFADHLAITNAVREGARFGAALDYNTSGWATTVRDRVLQTYTNDGNRLTNAQICVALVNDTSNTAVSGSSSWNGGSCGTRPAPSYVPPGACAVEVWVQKPATIELIVLPSLHPSLSARSVEFYARTAGSCTAS